MSVAGAAPPGCPPTSLVPRAYSAVATPSEADWRSFDEAELTAPPRSAPHPVRTALLGVLAGGMLLPGSALIAWDVREDRSFDACGGRAGCAGTALDVLGHLAGPALVLGGSGLVVVAVESGTR